MILKGFRKINKHTLELLRIKKTSYIYNHCDIVTSFKENFDLTLTLNYIYLGRKQYQSLLYLVSHFPAKYFEEEHSNFNKYIHRKVNACQIFVLVNRTEKQ